ncbi:MAG TPA: ATP-binding protein [Candidatus Paceibacterota bacterium]
MPEETAEHLKEVTEQLYKRNVDLAVRNKILSLLRELYQISILTLEPKDLATKVAEKVQVALDFELFGVFLYNENEMSLTPLGFSVSSKFNDSQKIQGCSLERLTIPNTSVIPTLAEVIKNKKVREISHIKDVWGTLMPTCDFTALANEANIKSTLVLPLVVRDQAIGLLMLCLNREYTELSQFERESIFNFVNIIAVALDKAILYKEIQIANARLKELDKQKSEFVSIASHQLRSPLTAIKGYSSMILEGSFGEINDKARGAIDRIFQSSQRLVLIIEDFLNLSRIEQGRMQYEWATIELRKLVEGVIAEMEGPLKDAQLSIDFSHDNQEYNITADEGKVRQVVTNIIDNAIKYTKHGGITLKIKKDSDTRKILLEITDTGIGIPPDVTPKLFQKFSRAEDAGKANIMGTGLGLYVAKQIMLAHRGNIWVDSEGAGKGSTFYLEFMAE